MLGYVVDHYIRRFGDLDDVQFSMVEDISACYSRICRVRVVEAAWIEQAITADGEPNQVFKIASAIAKSAESNKYKFLQRCRTAPADRRSTPG